MDYPVYSTVQSTYKLNQTDKFDLAYIDYFSYYKCKQPSKGVRHGQKSSRANTEYIVYKNYNSL